MEPSTRILIIEDNAELANHLQDMLTQMGYIISGQAVSVETALELARITKPNVLLLSTRLNGEGNGFQTGGQIQTALQVPIIYLGSKTDADFFPDHAHPETLTTIVTQPINFWELQSKIEIAVNNHASEQRLRVLQHRLQVQRDVQRLIRQEHDAQHLMEEVCKTLLSTSGYEFVWFGEVADERLKLLAAAGEAVKTLEDLLSSAETELTGNLPEADAIHTRNVLRRNEMVQDGRSHTWQAAFNNLHFNRTIAIPIQNETYLFGVLVVYAETELQFDDEETSFLVELADDLGFGFQAIVQDHEEERAETALRESEGRFRNLSGSSMVGLFIVQDDVFSYINPSLSQIFGYEPDELIGSSLMVIIHPDDRELVTDIFRRQLSDKTKPIYYEFRGWTKNNEIRFIEMIGGQVNVFGQKSIVGNIMDITERKQTIEKTEFALLQYSTDAAPDGAYWIDKQGRMLYANTSGCMMLGYTREELLNLTIFEINPRITPERWAQVWHDLNENKNIAIQSIHRRKDGSEFPVEVTSAYVVFHGQEFLNGFARDITDRKNAEHALLQSQEHFYAVVQTASDAIITMNSQQRITFWNAGAERIFGFGSDEMIGQPIIQIVPSKFREQSRQGADLVFTGSKHPISGKAIQTVGKNKDGKEFPIEMSFAAWSSESGQYVTGIIRDISERKSMMDQLQESQTTINAIIDSTSDLIWSVDPNTFEILTFNQGFSNFYLQWRNLTIQTGMRLEDLYSSKEYIRRWQSYYQQVLADGTFTTDYTISTGAVILQLNFSLLKRDNQIFGISIFGKDVTERNQYERELQSVVELSAALRTAPTRAEMLPVIVDQLISLLNFETATIEIIESQTGDAVVEAGRGIWGSLVGTRQKSGTGINTIIQQTLKPYITHNLKNDSNLTYPEWVDREINGCAGVPLIAQGKLIGFVWVGRKADISEVEVPLFAAIADIAANAIYRATLHEQAKKDAENLAMAYDSTLEGWAHALELRDQETEGHTRRVVQVTVELAKAMGFQDSELENIRRGALLHDIGKVGIPDSVLLKPGTLNEREWEIMRMHPEYAHDLLAPIEYLNKAMDIPYCHHEKWDGSGYPRQLAGEQIPLAARLFAVVDVWDALRSDRPYRKKWPEERVLEYIKAQSNTHFDPKVVDLFLGVMGKA